MLDEFVVIDADAHVRDYEDVVRPFLRGPSAQRLVLYPRDDFDRSVGGSLGKQQVGVETQIKDMEVEGIDLQVLFPTYGLHYGLLHEPEHMFSIVQGYNDWLHAFCQRDPARLKGVAMIPFLDMGAAVEELHRAVDDLGMVGVVQPSYIAMGPRNAGDAKLDPFYAECEKIGVPVCLHATGGELGERYRFFSFLQTHLHTHVPEQMICVTSIALGGVLAKFPRLKVGFMEAGCGWVPFWLEHMDSEWEKRKSEVPLLDKPPSEYIRGGQCYFGVEPEESGIDAAIKILGEQSLLYASDYPHWDSDWPETARILAHRTDLSVGVKRSILSENAKRFYNLTL